MCFSAAASFTSAVVIGAIGVATLAQKPEKRRLPFALIPLVFAVHQAIEGFIWLSFGASIAPSAVLVGAYLFFAQVFWPTFTPLSVLFFERGERRRGALWILLAVGAFVSVAMAIILMQHDYTVTIVDHSLRYATDQQFEARFSGLYLVATTTPLLIARHRYVMAFGAAVLANAIVTQLVFYDTAASVWCFFAALSSAFVFLHIRRQSRQSKN